MIEDQEPKKGIAAIILKKHSPAEEGDDSDFSKATDDAGQRMLSAFKSDNPQGFMDALNDYLDMRK
tara:strand:- start:321 stop:518 length:198 start_codon:yes stop_codon:yes gene_type:complete